MNRDPDDAGAVLYVPTHTLPYPEGRIADEGRTLLHIIVPYGFTQGDIPFLLQVLHIGVRAVLLRQHGDESPGLLPEPEHVISRIHSRLYPGS